MTSELIAAAGAVHDDVVALRRAIHREPELDLDLPRTQGRVLDALAGLPLTVRTGDRLSSIVADLDGERPGPTVLLRADMDALPMPEDTGLDYASTVPGVMHACGHDAHTAMLVGAARVLAERRGELAGRVRFFFQPGEEGKGGAELALREGLLDATDGGEAVSYAFAVHQSPSYRRHTVATKGGPLMASVNDFRVTLRGKGGHASMPHHAVDPVPVAAEVVLALQSLVTRRIDVFEPAVVTVTQFHAGTANNVIPEVVTLGGTIRTVSPATRETVTDGVRRVVTRVATAHDCEADVRITVGYPVTVNHAGPAADALDLARAIGDERAAVTMPAPVMGAEDFSYILDAVPGAMAFLGTRPEGVSAAHAAPNHSNRMVLNEDALVTGVALYAGTALRRLAPDDSGPSSANP